MSKNVKLKSLLEGYAWERNPKDFGKPLPTLEDIQKAHESKQKIEEENANSRMKGLLDQRSWKEAMSNLEGIIQFYQNEGFDNDEIVDFIQGKLEEDMYNMM
jgi:hypothetical protein